MSKAFEIANAQLALMSADELTELKARIGFRLQIGTGTQAVREGRGRPVALIPATPVAGSPENAPAGFKIDPSRTQNTAESDVDLVLSEILEFMNGEGIEFASLPMLKRMNNFRSFQAKVPPVMAFLRQATSNKTKLRYLLRIAVKLLFADMRAMNVAVSTKSLMNHFHRVPAIINRNFPGYAAAGYLTLLLHEGRRRMI